MAEWTMAGARVLEMRIARPRTGAWTADVVLDTDAPPTGRVVLAAADGSASFAGTVASAEDRFGHVAARVCGGAHGLSTALAPAYYRGATVRLVVADLLRAAGETLAGDSDAGILGAGLAVWTRAAAPAATALAAVLAPSGAVWRVRPDGALWIGREAWPTVSVAGDVMATDPENGALTLGTDAVPFALAPGSVFDGRRVSYVEHELTGDRTQTRVWFEAPGAALDAVASPLATLVRHLTGDARLRALFPGVVLAAGGDALDVQLDGSELPPLVGVPLRPWAPGCSQTVGAGARVLVAFEGGDPRAPVVVAFAPDAGAQTAVTLAAGRINLGAGATARAAREGDAVRADTSMAVWIGLVSSATGVSAPSDFGKVNAGSNAVRIAN